MGSLAVKNKAPALYKVAAISKADRGINNP